MNDHQQPHPSKIAPATVIRIVMLPALLTALGMLLLSACASNPRPTESATVIDSQLDLGNDEISAMNAIILSRVQSNSDPGDYLLGEGDLLQISVFEAKELNSTVRVSSRGLITLPLIESVDVKGLTAIEAEEKIEALYRQQYIKNPHVSIFVEEHMSQRVTLVGQFKNPGTYDYPSKLRLLNVIAMGGGLSDKAGQTLQIRQFRRTQDQANVIMIDLDQLIKEGDVQQNLEINGGDVLFVPEAGVFFVDGAVKRPGAYSIKHHTAVQEALVEAGGLESWAAKDKIKLFRIAPNGERETIDLDLNETGTKEMAVQDRDILMVDASGASGFMRGFSFTILGTGFSYWGR